jgi:hypothetical protein
MNYPPATAKEGSKTQQDEAAYNSKIGLELHGITHEWLRHLAAPWLLKTSDKRGFYHIIEAGLAAIPKV